MVQVADVVSETLSSTETSLATSAVVAWQPCPGPPQSCAPNARPFCPKSGGANLNGFPSEGLCALSRLAEGTESSLSKPHSSRTFRSQPGSSFRFQKSDPRSEKCRFENEMSLSQENFPIIPQLLVLPFYQPSGSCLLNLWATSRTYIHSAKLRRICFKDSPSSPAVSMGQPHVPQKPPLDFRPPPSFFIKTFQGKDSPRDGSVTVQSFSGYERAPARKKGLQKEKEAV